MSLNGVINVYKEKGYTSFDVVAKLRGILKQKKIGHTGTLDPDACGVLPVCLGSATKLCDFLTDKVKEYVVTMLLGTETDTEDISGKVINHVDDSYVINNVTTESLESAVNKFLGDFMQTPPMYSAIKVDGKKLYELAREGKVIERKKRPVTFFNIEILSVDLPCVKMRVSCSKGTYIRSLCRDIGNELKVYGCMKDLVRTKSGDFHIEDTLTLYDISCKASEGLIESVLIPVSEVLSGYDKLMLDSSYDKLLHNGNSFELSDEVFNIKENIKMMYRVFDSNGEFIGVFSACKSNGVCRLKCEKMFYGNNN